MNQADAPSGPSPLPSNGQWGFVGGPLATIRTRVLDAFIADPFTRKSVNGTLPNTQHSSSSFR